MLLSLGWCSVFGLGWDQNDLSLDIYIFCQNLMIHIVQMSTEQVTDTNNTIKMSAMTKVNKALRELEEEIALNAVNAFVEELKKAFEIEDMDSFVESYKTSLTTKMKEEAKKAAAAGKPKKAVKLDAEGHVVKREPSEYNVFIREAMLRLKEDPENKDVKGKELMAMAAAEWKKSGKSKAKKTETKSDSE